MSCSHRWTDIQETPRCSASASWDNPALRRASRNRLPSPGIPTLICGLIAHGDMKIVLFRYRLPRFLPANFGVHLPRRKPGKSVGTCGWLRIVHNSRPYGNYACQNKPEPNFRSGHLNRPRVAMYCCLGLRLTQWLAAPPETARSRADGDFGLRYISRLITVGVGDGWQCSLKTTLNIRRPLAWRARNFQDWPPVGLQAWTVLFRTPGLARRLRSCQFPPCGFYR